MSILFPALSMINRILHQPILLALAATLLIAGLFYLPYLAVRAKTIDNFRSQQVILARQAATDLQNAFTTYEKALVYLSQQPSIQQLDDSGRALLQDFYAIHREDLDAILLLDNKGRPLFDHPQGLDAAAATHCEQLGEQNIPLLSEPRHTDNPAMVVFLAMSIQRGTPTEGCLSFSLPAHRMARLALERLVLPRDTQALLLSQDGRILHAPAESLIGGSFHTLLGTAEERGLLQEAVALSESALIRLSCSPLPNATAPAQATYAVLYPVQLAAGQSWSILLLTPAHEVLGPMAEFRSQWLLVTGVVMVAVGLLCYFLLGVERARREEQRLRALQEQQVKLLELVPMGVLLLDQNQAVIYANLAGKRLIGEEQPESIIGRSLGDFLDQADRGSVTAQIAAQKPGATITIDHAVLRTGDGTRRDIGITASASLLGNQQQCILLIRDISEERRALAWQRRLATAVDQVKEAVLIAAVDGTIEYANRAVTEMTGYGRRECIGQPVQLLWAKEQDAHCEQKMADMIAVGEVWRGRIVNQRKDGSLFVAAATVSPMRDQHEMISHFVLVQRDITHEVEIETRMRQAQKMEAIGTLAGGIAHDFNNILGGIIGFTDMALLQATPQSDLHNNLLHIRQGGKRAADLVQQILTFSRQSVEERHPVLVAPLVQESLKLMRATLPTTIEITQELTATELKVVAAPVQIQQIVMNLCANAFSAMKEKGGHLTIRLRRQNGAGIHQAMEPDKRWAMLQVEDTGMGMEDAILQRIFTPFFTTKQPGEGTGMGLSVVHGIVRELGGEIAVQSEPGQGTVFTVLLPVAEQNGNGGLLSSEEPLLRGSEHILVVDDEQEIRETCRMMLGHLGYTVTTSATPLEVLGMIARAQPPIDLVITDQTMPKLTGLDLAEEIRRRHPHIPVILCTGYSDKLNYDIAREAGACDLLMKPVDLHDLSVAVRCALEMSR